MGGDVRLVDLDVIKRYSLAVRQESAPADELLASLDASRAIVLAIAKPPKPVKPMKPMKKAVAKPINRTATPTTSKRPAKSPSRPAKAATRKAKAKA